MKQFNIKTKALSITFMACSLLSLSSCDEKDFLSIDNPNSVTEATFWKSPSQFNSALTTVYAAMQFQAISGVGIHEEELKADIGDTYTFFSPLAYRQLTYTDNSPQVVNKWNQLYIGIFRANQVINQINKVDASTFAPKEKESILAQARFLRAFFYFKLVHTYGKAVIRTEVSTTDLDKPTSTIQEVNDQVIIPDLTYAKENLPTRWTGLNVGRVTWGSATSLLGKVYLYDKKWAPAAAEFKEVIDSKIYSLTPNILDNFTDQNEFNSESILEVAYSSTANPGANGANVDDTPFASGAEANAIGGQYASISYGGFNTVVANYYLHELFTNDEIDTSNPINTTNVQSRRLTASICPKNFEGTYFGVTNSDTKVHAYRGLGLTALVKKGTNWYQGTSEIPLNRSGINFRHIRLADVYLMYAEAVLNATSDVNEAIKYIDLVRARAGVKTLTQYLAANSNTFPQLHISKQRYTTQPMVAPTKQNILTHIQMVERPLELCFEGFRWNDLVRWGLVKDVFTTLDSDLNWKKNNLATILNKAPIYIEGSVNLLALLGIQNYSSAVHDYFPIPAAELQSNKGL
ncbi:RagB/SusD family nutrient uptake outer membrane protein [Flavobacterium sp. NG2]|uniref:RagB/SusD family nutrient uptake outer membrane protein n=1 Tax=Flavobacterium sp. NG2 TaxID=3097547 RepID=UPI002A807212|nr:RagB/SusD family nutrient uptake outer membrane protein [Flavobacterium sp. NG2]WPR73132.1 RagB/SusD family nutrient uptake outer membrane protein [Flavobacterium sp. NG2]